MFLTYVWQPRRLSIDRADRRFAQILQRQQDLLADGWGVPPDLSIHRHGRLLIGQLCYDAGLTGWQPWDVRDTGAIVWSGVCEHWLGRIPDPTAFQQILQTVDETPHDICRWDGRYALVTWSRQHKTVTLTTAAVESPSLWYTQGSDGWAAGNRCGPLLDMVDQGRRPDPDSVRLFLAHGYLYGDGALFAGVKRIPCRQQVLFGHENGPEFRAYASMMGSLDLEGVEARSGIEAARQAADVVVSRVRKQITHSKNPLLLLSGGRDSRCIAAAANRADGELSFVSSGAPDSAQVRAATMVAERLQLNHRTARDRPVTASAVKARFDTWLDFPDRLRLWMRLNEGLESLVQSSKMQRFFRGELRGRPSHGPLFHGHGGNLLQGGLYPVVGSRSLLLSRDVDTARLRLMHVASLSAPPGMVYPRDLVEALYQGIDREVGPRPTVIKWLDAFHWQFKSTHWGEDMLAAKSVASWRWTPLYDRELLRLWFLLGLDDKGGSRFMEQVVQAIEPALAGIPYDRVSPFPSGRAYVREIILVWLRTQFARTRIGGLFKVGDASPIEPALSRFWNQVFFTRGDHPWREFVTPSVLREAVDNRPGSGWLWSLATVELFIRENC